MRPALIRPSATFSRTREKGCAVCTSPARGRGRRAAAGEGSVFSRPPALIRPSATFSRSEGEGMRGLHLSRLRERSPRRGG
jgi:hypothetical protein